MFPHLPSPTQEIILFKDKLQHRHQLTKKLVLPDNWKELKAATHLLSKIIYWGTTIKRGAVKPLPFL